MNIIFIITSPKTAQVREFSTNSPEVFFNTETLFSLALARLDSTASDSPSGGGPFRKRIHDACVFVRKLGIFLIITITLYVLYYLTDKAREVGAPTGRLVASEFSKKKKTFNSILRLKPRLVRGRDRSSSVVRLKVIRISPPLRCNTPVPSIVLYYILFRPTFQPRRRSVCL